MSRLQLFDGYAIYGPPEVIAGKLLFGFDLDHTIIRPTAGTFYRGITDWEFMPGIVNPLRLLKTAGVIAVFTNQGGVAAGKTTIADVVARIDAVMKKLGFEFLTFIALAPRYRKPSPLLFRELIYGYMPEFEKGFYCGDAAGAEDDFADTDYRFALNTGLKFIRAQLFTRDCKYTGTSDPPIDIIADLENTAQRWQPAVQLAHVPVRDYIVAGAVFPPIPDGIILLVGPPGCGKSTYSAGVQGYKIVSRDALGTAAKCVTAVKRATFDKNPRVIVDATHPDAQSREPFVKIAATAKVPTYAVVFTPPPGVAMHMNRVRAICGGNYVPDIAYGMFAKRFTMPTAAEGFAGVIIVDKIPMVEDNEFLDMYL